MRSKKYILREIKRLVSENSSNAKIYLYGSRARGKAHKDSDWDILILIDNDKITPDIEMAITYPLYD